MWRMIIIVFIKINLMQTTFIRLARFINSRRKSFKNLKVYFTKTIRLKMKELKIPIRKIK